MATPLEDLFSRAVALHQTGNLAGAETLYERLMQLCPEDPALQHMYGMFQFSKGQPETALAYLLRARQLQPDDPGLLSNLGIVLATLGRVPEAEACFRELTTRESVSASAYLNLSRLLRDTGRFAEAIAVLQTLCQRAPESADAWYQLAWACERQGLPAEARAAVERSLTLQSNRAEAWNLLGTILISAGDPASAERCFLRAIELDPNFAAACSNLARRHQQQGRLADAGIWYDRSIALTPNDPVLLSNRLVFLNYLPNISDQQLADEHAQWFQLCAVDRQPLWRRRTIDKSPERPLRIGYVSPDFCGHAVATFAIPLFQHHDRSQFEVTAFSNLARADAITEQLKRHVPRWHDVWGWSDERMLGQIAQDEIDILVDLSGHTGHHRLLVFANKPAPVQVSYLGYPTTTGLPTIDYRLTDAVCDPPGQPWFGTEQLVRLPNIFAAYVPWSDAPAVNELPARQRGYPTFGSLHNLCKLNNEVIGAWSTILQRLPTARLLIMRDTLVGSAREWLLSQFSFRGISAERLDLRQYMPAEGAFLNAYHEIDLALDVFPWSGHTTACEALWMGVPVVTRRGDRCAGRMVSSVLTSLGRTEWIAASTDEYIDKVVGLASDTEQLAHWRRELRLLCARSPACDHVSLVRNIETTYREMWRTWCAS